jgi:hypothetical protein
MTRQEKLENKIINKKSNTCLKVSLVVVLTLSLFKMILSNRASTWGHALEDIQSQTYQLQKQNLHLKQQLAQKTGGLDQLAEAAKKQGFTDKPQYQYFTSPETVAQVLP